MNSRESDLDRLQADDIAGIRSIYANAAVATGGSGCQVGGSDTSTGWVLTVPALLLALQHRRHSRETRERRLRLRSIAARDAVTASAPRPRP